MLFLLGLRLLKQYYCRFLCYHIHMTPEEREMLRKTLELSEENNKMLRAIRRSIFWGRVTRIAYWVIIIGAAIGLFYYLQPYIDTATSVYSNIKGDLQNFGDLFR